LALVWNEFLQVIAFANSIFRFYSALLSKLY
jgi:hypothetical protein